MGAEAGKEMVPETGATGDDDETAGTSAGTKEEVTSAGALVERAGQLVTSGPWAKVSLDVPFLITHYRKPTQLVMVSISVDC